MPVQTTYPGVYVQEIPSGVTSISGVSTSVALFIGMSQNGPMKTPIQVLNNQSYEKAFGTDISAGEMPDQVRQFFLNGGQQAWIMRIANGASASAITLKSEFGTPVLALEAKNWGQIGDSLRLAVDYDTATPEATFNLTVYRVAAGSDGTLQPVGQPEVYSDLTMDPNGPRYAPDTLRDNSDLVTPSATQPATVTPIKGYMLGGVPTATNTQAAQLTAINAALVGNVGSFAISVDGSAPVPVNLTGPLTVANIASTTNAFLNAVAKAITFDIISFGGLWVAQFKSAATGGSVRIVSSQSATDIAGKLGWTADTGAIEVGGYAMSRPAPNGMVAFLGDPSTTPLTNLATLLNTQKSTANVAVTLGDTPANGLAATTPPALGTGAQPMSQDSGGNGSLGNFKANLAAIAASFQTLFATQTPAAYRAGVTGFRLVIKSLSGDGDAGAHMTVSPANPLTAMLTGHANVNAYRPTSNVGLNPSSFVSATGSGSNGAKPGPQDYDDAFAKATTDIDIFNIVMLPRADGQTDTDRANLWGPASAFAKGRRAFLIVDPPSAWKTPAQASAGLPGMRVGMLKDYSAIYWPRVSIPDPVTGIQRYIDPAGTVAGVYARTDSARGVWKAPAGLDSATVGVRALERRMSDDENGTINPLALNALRVFPDGVVVWGARTMDGYDNSGDTDYRYVPPRRTALFIEESLYRGLKFAVFEPNDEHLWARIRLAAGSFMNTLFRQGAFQGVTKDTAYFVKCDKDTTTQTDINLGVVNVLVGFAALRPAEFVVITVQQMAGQIQV